MQEWPTSSSEQEPAIPQEVPFEEAREQVEEAREAGRAPGLEEKERCDLSVELIEDPGVTNMPLRDCFDRELPTTPLKKTFLKTSEGNILLVMAADGGRDFLKRCYFKYEVDIFLVKEDGEYNAYTSEWGWGTMDKSAAIEGVDDAVSRLISGDIAVKVYDGRLGIYSKI